MFQHGAAQTKLGFKSDGKLTIFPGAYGFGRTEAVIAQFDQDKSDAATFYKGRKKIVEDMKKAAAELEKSLTRDVRDFYDQLWGVDFVRFTEEERLWSEYLNNHGQDTAYPIGAFTFFPLPPTMNELRAGFQVSATEGKDPKTEKLGVLFSGKDWIVRGVHPEFSFFFQQVDVFRQKLIEGYNKDRPVEFKDISADDLKAWRQQLLDRREDSARLGKEIESTNFLEPSCERIKIDKLLTDTRQSHWYQLLSNDFYLKWLWYSRGALKLNPLGFTTPDRFQYFPTAEEIRRSTQFDDLYADRLKCEICKTNADSLATIIKDQKTGNARFLEDSLAAVKGNQKLLDNFQTNRKQLNRFTWPVAANEDDDPDDNKTILVQEYDAAHHYRRIHNLYFDRTKNRPTKASRREGENNIPDDVSAAVAVHNVPASKQISIDVTEADLKDASKAEILVDTAIAMAASLYSQFNPLAATIGALVKAPPNLFTGAANAILAPTRSASVPVEKIEVGEKAHIVRPIPTKTYQFKIYDSSIDVVVLPNGTLIECEKVEQNIVIAVINHHQVSCTRNLDSIAAAWVRDMPNPNLCHFPADRRVYQQEVNIFVLRIERRLRDQIANTKGQLAKQLTENSKLYNYLLQIDQASGAILPPDQLESELNSDTAAYSTLTQYLVPTKTPVTEKYQISLNANGKATPLAKGAVNIAPKHRVELSAGFAFTINKPDLITVSGSGSTLAINRDNSFARFIVGANFYPFAGGLYHPDNRFIIHRGRGKTYDRNIGLSALNRISFFLGIGIPQPLQNFYSGLSADLWPGIRFNAGLHWLYYTRYQIINSQISSQHSAIDDGRIYLGLTINPSSLVNFLNIFKQ